MGELLKIALIFTICATIILGLGMINLGLGVIAMVIVVPLFHDLTH